MNTAAQPFTIEHIEARVILPYCKEATPWRQLIVCTGLTVPVLLVIALLASVAAYGYLNFLAGSWD